MYTLRNALIIGFSYSSLFQGRSLPSQVSFWSQPSGLSFSLKSFRGDSSVDISLVSTVPRRCGMMKATAPGTKLIATVLRHSSRPGHNH
jgi:hypothetical protein